MPHEPDKPYQKNNLLLFPQYHRVKPYIYTENHYYTYIILLHRTSTLGQKDQNIN